MANAGGWTRLKAAHYVYRNASGTALAYISKQRQDWISEIRQGDRFVATKVYAPTLAKAKTETEIAYREQRATSK